ncbi:hypothetical protein [Thermococcus paralvinellae]|uniref:hypothetical protein n=1 Tax=Thermococcus paralvinellae TaxID=582419 RepID=UPI00130E8286|nr:hypothetical protein [Thermococcus paralvinellae]
MTFLPTFNFYNIVSPKLFAVTFLPTFNFYNIVSPKLFAVTFIIKSIFDINLFITMGEIIL